MIRWPHLGLYGSFSNCEAGLVEAISKNFFILDVLTQGRILGIVENLPDDPLEGDAYIIETYSYGAENSIMVWDGDEWKEIIPEAGFLMFNDQLGQFFWFDGASWLAWPIDIGDVTGPSSSLDNSIAIFDGVTGKFIQDSGIIIDDDDTITGVVGIYAVDFIASNVTKTENFEGAFTVNSSSVGNDQTVSFPTLVVKFTGALNSISTISPPPASSHAREHTLLASTGDDLILRNNSSIRTGTGSDLKIKSGAGVRLTYDLNGSQWVVIGGSGSGGGGIQSVVTLTDDPTTNDIPVDTGVLYIMNSFDGDCTAILPDITTVEDGWATWFKRSESANRCVIQPNADSSTIEGQTERDLLYQYDLIMIFKMSGSVWGIA